MESLIDTLNQQPLFSIGVTTYNRRNQLQELLTSISNQTFGDFEVIVGNDYTEEVLSKENLGVTDSRVHIVNNPINLGEDGNMNALLTASTGKYFTWMADDDLYHPDFLKIVHDAITKVDGISCVYTNYNLVFGLTNPVINHIPSNDVKLLKGSNFLQSYLAGRIKCIPCYGVFHKKALQDMGGMERLSSASVGLYGEYLFLAKVGLLPTVGFVDSPLIHYRAHDQSAATNSNLQTSEEASKNLVIKTAEIFQKAELMQDFHANMSSIIKHCFRDFCSYRRRGKYPVDPMAVVSFFYSLQRGIWNLKGKAALLVLCILVRECVRTSFNVLRSKWAAHSAK
jgi:hypothetical protein